MTKSILRFFLAIACFFTYGQARSQSTFSVVKSMLETHCTVGCHNSIANAGLMNLTGTDAAVYSQIVNVTPINPAAASKGDKRITPGYPDRSFLLRKCNNGLYPNGGLTAGEGNAMPDGQPALANNEIELIRQWVYKGSPLTGTVVDTSVINDYYANGGINSIPNPPAVPTDPGAFQLHLGKIFLAPQTEAEYFIKYDLRLPEDIKVDRIEMIMAPQSHHFIIYKFLPGEEGSFASGLRLQNPDNGAGSSGASSTLVNAWQISFDTHLPEGTAYYWPSESVLDLNYHMRNYATDSVLAVEAYINVYTLPASSPEQIMYSTLLTNLNIFIPNDNAPHSFSKADFDASQDNYWNIWQLTSHTHKYGIDFDIFKRNANGSQGTQIYEGFYDVNYSFNQGYYNFSHPAIRQFEPLETFNPRHGLIQQATFQNDGPSPVFFGLTTQDEMMVYYMQFTLGDLIDETGIEDFQDQLKLNVFPNPSDGIFNVSFVNKAGGTVSVQLTDVAGREVYSGKLNTGSGQQTAILDAGQLTSGLYFLQVSSESGKSVKRIAVR